MSIDAQILTALRASPTVSGADLSSRLGISRAAIWARIEEMRSLGYEIEASPHYGYRLTGVPDLLHADDLKARLGTTKVVGRDIQVFRETTSTNDVTEKLARDGVKEGVVVFAEAQTRGRGRLGRRWKSPAGKGIWCSVLLRPEMRPQAATQLTVIAATALVRAIRLRTSLEPEIKWPNDVLIGGRKVAGILTELSAELDSVRYVILGIGIDVNMNAEDLGSELKTLATSLKIESGQTVDRSALAATFLRELDGDYEKICNGAFAGVADEWERHCTMLGKWVRVRVGDRLIQGRAESLDPDGGLLVRSEHGLLERVLGGDVTVEK